LIHECKGQEVIIPWTWMLW